MHDLCIFMLYVRYIHFLRMYKILNAPHYSLLCLPHNKKHKNKKTFIMITWSREREKMQWQY